MENGGQVYVQTTVPAEPALAKKPLWGVCTVAHLGWRRFLLKLLQLVLSFLAFVLEEVVSQCTQCAGLYFFQFVSCIAFLLCLSIVFIYCTSLCEKIGKEKLIKPEMYTIPAVGIIFLIASIVFSATSDKTSVEKAAIVFGFFASFAFLVEAGLQIFKQRKTQEERQSENTANTVNATENQPLNN